MRSLDFGQLMLVGFIAAGTAILGAGLGVWLTTRRAMGAAAESADNLIQAAGGQTVAAAVNGALKGGLWGAVLGFVLGAAYLWWSTREESGESGAVDYDERDPGDSWE